MKENQLKNENIKLNQAITEAVRSEFPEIGTVTSPLSQVKALIKKQGVAGSGPSANALDVLSNISKARQGVKVNFYEIEISDGEVKLKAETDSFQNVDNIRASFEKLFAKTEVVDQVTKPGGKVDFYLKLENLDPEYYKIINIMNYYLNLHNNFKLLNTLLSF